MFNGLQIFERDEMFRQQVGNLQLIVGVYNNVQATILPVEKPLITQKLEAVDSTLKKGLQVSSKLLTTYLTSSTQANQCIYASCCANTQMQLRL